MRARVSAIQCKMEVTITCSWEETDAYDAYDASVDLAAKHCLLQRKRFRYWAPGRALSFQPDGGQWSGDNCTVRGRGDVSIREPPQSRTESGSPYPGRILHSLDPGPRLSIGTRDGPEWYLSRSEAQERIPLTHSEPVTLVAPPTVEQRQICDTPP
jgi:hypothetical protein